MIFSILKTLALGIWLGLLLMLGIAVAGPIFQQSPSKTLSGQINGVILGRMNGIEWVCAGIALISAIALVIMQDSARSKTLRLTEIALLVIATVLLWFYSQKISGRMEELRMTIKDFDHPQQTTEYVQAKSEFDSLHHTYTKLVGANMFILLGEFALSMVTAIKLPI